MEKLETKLNFVKDDILTYLYTLNLHTYTDFVLVFGLEAVQPYRLDILTLLKEDHTYGKRLLKKLWQS